MAISWVIKFNSNNLFFIRIIFASQLLFISEENDKGNQKCVIEVLLGKMMIFESFLNYSN